MKISSLKISNFRGIQFLEASGLGDTIIIAGQNGSGKSCIFDSIRLLKSTYGGYQQNEWQHFFGEFQIQLTGGAKNLKGLFNDPSKECLIEVGFILRENERDYILKNAAELLEHKIWQTLLPEAFQFGGYAQALFAQQFRERQPEVDERVKNELPELLTQIAEEITIGRIIISPAGRVDADKNRLLEVVFTNYRPRQIGVVDFHGAQRHYGREIVQGINLSLDQANQQHSQHTLYNYNNKYNNVKSEMAGNFIKELLAQKAGSTLVGQGIPIHQTLTELFETFFPEKKFLGTHPTIDGGLEFPVLTPAGTQHDLDELSSGEKEILYGYLRIRSSAPRESIILLDEPELHLNPRLIRGLPEFYRKHLGESLSNQLWLVTHSDALIREAVGKPGFNVFHMTPCGLETANRSQLHPLTVTQDLERVLTDLVGDLAAYRPDGKAIIFEGGGDSDFDRTVASKLFSEELRGINLISGTNKTKVKALHEILEKAYSSGDLTTKFFAILDRDTDTEGSVKGLDLFQWDVYHIENYLLDFDIIADVLNSVNEKNKWASKYVEEAMQLAAQEAIPNIVSSKVITHCNSKLMSQIKFNIDPKTKSIAEDLSVALQKIRTEITQSIDHDLVKQKLAVLERDEKIRLKKSFEDGSWKNVLPGRVILKRFIEHTKLGLRYDLLRNLIVNRMRETGHKPAGMRKILEAIQHR